MTNKNNLKPPLNQRTTEERREIARKGGKKSGEVRRERKKLKELLELALQLPNEETGEQNDIAIVKSLILKALGGDVKAFEVIRDTVGEKPVEAVETTAKVNGSIIVNDLSKLDTKTLLQLAEKADIDIDDESNN